MGGEEIVGNRAFSASPSSRVFSDPVRSRRGADERTARDRATVRAPRMGVTRRVRRHGRAVPRPGPAGRAHGWNACQAHGCGTWQTDARMEPCG
jgi:hypothetical protein